MVVPQDERSVLMNRVSRLLADRRGRRFTVYIEPSTAERAISLVESRVFESRSLVLDTALRSQLLCLLESTSGYRDLLEGIDSLEHYLSYRIPCPSNISGVESPAKRRPTANERGRKVRVSSRTNEAIHLLGEVLVDDPEIPYSHLSQIVEQGVVNL